MSSDSFELVREDASNPSDAYDVKESSTAAVHESDSDVPSPSSSLASSILSSPGEDLNDPLRQALTQAQTRARLSDEKIHWLMEHVDRCIKATMKEVHQAKYEVRRLRKIVNDEEEQAAADESTIHTRHHPFQRSVSDTPPQFSQRGAPFNPSLFLSPLSSTLPSAALSSASSSSRLTAPPLNLDSILDASSTPNETGTTNSDEHSSSSSMSPPPSIPGNSSVTNGNVMEESYCMLPMGESMTLTGGGELSSSSASSSTHALNIGIPHSASLKAMIEAGEAYHELSRDSTPIVQDESKSLTGFPASPIVSNSLTSACNIDLSAAPSPISQSARSQSNTQLGGLASGSGAPRPISLNRGVSIGGASSSPGLVGLRSRPPHQPLLRQHQLTHSQSVQSLRNMKPLQQNNLNEGSSSLGVTLASVPPVSSLSSISSTPALGPLSSSSSSSISPARRDLASAVRAFKEAQIRFDALTHLCAPIVFQSQRYVRLKERASLQQFGVINSDDEDESHRRRNHITDEELSDSTTPNDEANPENNTTLAERMEMEIYLKKIRTEIAEEEEKGGQSTTMNKQDGATSASAPSSTDVLDQPSIFGSSLTMVDHPQSFSLEEAYQSCVLLYQELKAREEEIKRIKDEKQEGEHKHQQEIESSRARCSALEQRDRNIASILERLKIPIDEKGNLPDGYQLQAGSSFWHKSLTAVAFGSLLFASCISWKHIFSHISDGSDRLIKVCVSIGISEEWIRKLLTTLHLHSATAASTASASASSAVFSSASAASSEAAATAAAAAASAAATAAINRATTVTSTSIPSNAAASMIGQGSRGREYVHLPFSSSSSYTGHFSSPPPAPLPSSFHSADFVEDTSFHVFPRLFDFIARFSIQYMTVVVQ